MTKLNKWVIALLVCCLITVPASARRKVVEADTITLLSFNDFHGYFAPDAVAPGASALVQSLLDEKATSPHPFIVSAGDNFSGSFFSKITQGEPLPDMFRLLGVEISAVGNHEFDWGKDFLLNTASKSATYIAANIELMGQCNQPWLPPYKILSCTLKKGAPFRIAFIGLTTVETKYKTSSENVAGLDFIHPYAAAAIQLATNLKHEGKIDMVVLLTHLGTDMIHPDRFQECNSKMLPYMEGIDAIITAHSHQVVLDTINKIPIVQAGSYGRYMGKLQFKVMPQKKSDAFVVEYIGGDTIAVDRNKHNPEMEKLVNSYREKYRFDEVLTHTEEDVVRKGHSYSPMGSLVTASYVSYFKKTMPEMAEQLPVIGVNHAGGIRNDFPKGNITRLDAANILPFAGQVVAFRFTGAMLKKLLNDGRRNRNGMLQACHMNLYLENDSVAAVEYTGHGDPCRIADEDECIVVLDNYIIDGGDQYDSKLFVDPIVSFNEKQLITTDAFVDYLKAQPSVRKQDIPIPRLLRKP